jgi:hypothetical protein
LKRLEIEIPEQPSDGGRVVYCIPYNGRGGPLPRSYVSGNATVIIYDPKARKKETAPQAKEA